MIEIPGWNERFEVSQSRKSPHRVSWTPIPHSFASLLRMQPPEVAAAMFQIVILAAGMPTRGVLHDGGRDLTLEDVGRCVGATSQVVAAATTALGVHREIERKTDIQTERKRRTTSKEAVEVAECLRDALLSHTPDHRCGHNGAHEKWAVDIDKAIRLEKRTPEALMGAIEWAHRLDPREFWRSNIQSGAKLREQFDQLTSQASRPPSGAAGRSARNAETMRRILQKDAEGADGSF